MEDWKMNELDEEQLGEITGGFLKKNGATIYGEPYLKNNVQMYRVGRGDKLAAIAAFFGTTTTAICRLNHTSDPRLGNHVIQDPQKIQPTWPIRVR